MTQIILADPDSAISCCMREVGEGRGQDHRVSCDLSQWLLMDSWETILVMVYFILHGI